MSTINPSRIARAQHAPRARRAVAARGVAAAPLRLAARRRRRSASPRSGLLMIYSTTHQRIPGDPYYFVKRQALFAVHRHRGDGRRAARRLQAPPRSPDGVLRRDRLPARSRCSRRSARTSRATRPGSSCPGGFTLQPSELAKFGIIVFARRLLQPLPRRDRRVAPHRDHRAGERARSVWCCCSPTSGR